MWKKLLAILLLPLLFAGCATTFTNLTPLHQPRNANNLYPIEVQFDSRERAIRWDTIQPSVLIGAESYPLRKVRMLNHRWEGLIPVPAGANSVDYRYKFDYEYSDFGGPVVGTKYSLKYTLHVLDQ